MPPGPLQDFAQGLRDLRATAGNPSYRAMERRAGYSASALSAAASGDRLPSLAVTQAYVGACAGDQDEWTEKWHTLRTELDQAHDAVAASEAAVAHRPLPGRPGRHVLKLPARPGRHAGKLPATPGRHAVKLFALLIPLGLTALVTAGALIEDPPPGSGSPAPTPLRSAPATPRSAPAASAQQGARPAFTAVAGPNCPRDTVRSVHITGLPGQDGWKDAGAAGWTGAGCGDGFLFSDLTYDPGLVTPNSFQWRFTTGLRDRRQCLVAVYIPKSGLAGREVSYTVKDGFGDGARAIAEFRLDQRLRQGTWVPAPVPVTVDGGLVMIEITDTGKGNATGDRSMAAGPIQLSCP